MHTSIWKDTVSMPSFRPMEGDAKTDVLIIGGGLCGILCAYFLQERGVNYMLCEGDTIGNGITKNTTAKITSLHGLLYKDLKKSKGTELASLYLRANEDAVERFRQIAQDVLCDFEDTAAYTYSLKNRKKIEDEVHAINALGGRASFAETLSLPFKTYGAVRVPLQAQFHPLKFIAGIAKHLNIYEHTFIRDIQKGVAYTDSGTIRAKRIIVATHFPFLKLHGGYFLKMYQQRSYILALTDATLPDGMYRDENENGLSFRNYRNYLLLGGNNHRTGMQSDGWEPLRSLALTYYPAAKEKYAFATQDCITPDKVPYIGPYAATTSNLYVASGFNKWGMTGSMVAAMLLADLVCDKENPYATVFSPTRGAPIGKLLQNGLTSSFHLLTPSMRRCPHLGCALKWNPSEQSWDCPCHGSRFQKDGTLQDNPATHSIEKEK